MEARELKRKPEEIARRFTPHTLDELMTLAKMLAGSDLVPKEYRDKPGNIVIAVQLGAEVGLPWAQALQSIAVIGGRPSLWGDAGLAIVMASPDFEGIRETDDEATETATCWLRRKGLEPVIRSFSQADAERIQVWEKDAQGNPRKVSLADRPVWKAGYTKRMRQMRARWWAMKDLFPDRLKGLEGREWTEADHTEAEHPPEEPAPDLAPRRKSETVVVEAPAAKEPELSHAPESPVPAEHTAETMPLEASSAKTTFTINDHQYETAGINKDQMLACFRLAETIKKKMKGAGLDKALLKNEFGLASRTRLTEEQAEKYLVRLSEIANADA